MPKKTLVTGATGNLGSAVVKSLRGRGITVKAASTDPRKVTVSAGVEPVKLVYQDTSTFQDALSGVDTLFLIALPMDPDAPAKLRPIIDMARASGVEHIVFNSALGADQNEQAPLRVIERHLMASGVNYTILRPNFFMQNFSKGFAAPMIRDHDGIFLAAGDGKTSFIATEDIAEAAAVSLAEGRFGTEWNLTGPEALDHTEVAEIISAARGKKVVYHPLSEEEMLQGARGAGMPEGSVQYMGILYSLVRAGYMAGLTADVQQVTGRKPLTFAEFARNNASLWK